MKKNISVFQIAAVFVGTVVGAGLASGQEICQFFTSYGYKSFIGIIICCLIYIFFGIFAIKYSIKFKLNSYNQLIDTVSPGFLGKITDLLTGLFLVSSAAIILAGSGSLIHQYFKISKWFGIILMASVALITLLRDTEGLIEINSLIVPSLCIVIVTISLLYLFLYKDIITINYVKNISSSKNNWITSALLYGGFNVLCCSGVLVPLSSEINNQKKLTLGIIIGSIILTILCLLINLLLLINIPYIFKYEIPLLYITNRFGKIIEITLLAIIWFEMFSTEVSDIYSVAKTLEESFNIPYKLCCLLIILLAIPISQIGFVTLIRYLYPAFGIISVIFVVQCIFFHLKNKK